MYPLLKNLTVPEFLNAAAAAAGILQLSINSISDLRKREILPKVTLLCGISGMILLLLMVCFPSANLPVKNCFTSFLFDTLKKAGCILLLLLLPRISHGGIGLGDIKSLISLACCCSFSVWITSLILGFLLTFLPAAAMFLTSLLRHHSLSARCRSIPFIPFLLAGFLLSSFLAFT